MLASFLTTIFFSLSAILATRSIRVVGAPVANLGRLSVAFLVLGLYAFTAGQGFTGAGRDWFLLSGVIGMGLGDIALFAALPRLGSRLAVLMTQCLAVPIAMVAEWAWMHTRLAGTEVAWATVILVGVAVALMPSKRNPPRVRLRASGFVFGLLSAAGQGFGAVLSRRAYEATARVGESIDGITAAFQRISGGLVIVLLWLAVAHLLRSRPADAVSPRRWNRGAVLIGLALVTANALAGPVIGVSCYQWALSSTPSGIVLPIVATTPLVIVPLSFWLEGDRPTRRSFLGGIIAVAGVVALTVVR
jgi:drug/metabolite transporter (DMT)-like permease